MLEYNPEHIVEPYMNTAKKILNLMKENRLDINDIDRVFSCVNCIVRFSSISNIKIEENSDIDDQDK